MNERVKELESFLKDMFEGTPLDPLNRDDDGLIWNDRPADDWLIRHRDRYHELFRRAAE